MKHTLPWFFLITIMYYLLNRLTVWYTCSSFLFLQVKDTVEVDKNVSRHLSYELSKNDWDLLVSQLILGIFIHFFSRVCNDNNICFSLIFSSCC